MNEIKIPGLDIDWAKMFSDLHTTGLDLGLNRLAAVVIFYVGRMVARILTNGVRRLMEGQSVDPILVRFVTSLVQ